MSNKMPPEKTPAVKVIAMPADTNADGDIFGGWILSVMDSAAALIARQRARKRVATVAINNMKFERPASVGDCIECYGEVTKVGTTSLTVKIEAWVERRKDQSKEKVTEGEFIFVALDKDKKPTSVD